LNTLKTKHLVEKHNIKVLQADKTHQAPEVDRLLIELGNPDKFIPYYAVYPADGGEPILFGGGLITQQQVLDYLEQAGPSDVASTGKTVMK
jgi:thiol:disulfide interchange protein